MYTNLCIYTHKLNAIITLLIFYVNCHDWLVNIWTHSNPTVECPILFSLLVRLNFFTKEGVHFYKSVKVVKNAQSYNWKAYYTGGITTAGKQRNTDFVFKWVVQHITLKFPCPFTVIKTELSYIKQTAYLCWSDNINYPGMIRTSYDQSRLY